MILASPRSMNFLAQLKKRAISSKEKKIKKRRRWRRKRRTMLEDSWCCCMQLQWLIDFNCSFLSLYSSFFLSSFFSSFIFLPENQKEKVRPSLQYFTLTFLEGHHEPCLVKDVRNKFLGFRKNYRFNNKCATWLSKIIIMFSTEWRIFN